MYTVSQVANIVNVTKETVRRWIRLGELKADTSGIRGKEIQIAEEDFKTFIEEHPLYASAVSDSATKNILDELCYWKERCRKAELKLLVLRDILNDEE